METIDVRAEEVYVVAKISAREIRKLKIAMGMCEGGPGRTDEEKAAWSFFTEVFWPYIKEMDKGLSDGSRS